MAWTQAVQPPVLWATERMWAKCSGQLGGEGGLLKVEDRDIKQDLFPYMGQLEFTNVPIEGWIIDPDAHVLLNGPCNVVHLPTHYGEVVNPSVMTCGVSMVIDGGNRPKMFVAPFP